MSESDGVVHPSVALEIADRPGSWTIVGTEDVYRGPGPFAVRIDRLRSPNNADALPFSRLLVEHPGAVVVLAVDDAKRVCCLRHYRHPVQATMLELPAGLRDVPGEDPIEVGKRELAEEAEMQAREWAHLISAYSSPGLSAERIEYVFATGLSATSRGNFEMHDEEAEIEVTWVPFDDLYRAILAGSIGSGPMSLAVLTAVARGLLAAPSAQAVG